MKANKITYLFYSISKYIFSLEVELLFNYPNVFGLEIPLCSDTQSGSVNTTGNVDTLGKYVNVFQGTLDTIKDRFHDARTKFHRQGFTCP